ncbi:MAG: hypothetical protein GDYSWBUE_001599 [Candidatus Fervidibacterota bacterium]
MDVLNRSQANGDVNEGSVNNADENEQRHQSSDSMDEGDKEFATIKASQSPVGDATEIHTTYDELSRSEAAQIGQPSEDSEASQAQVEPISLEAQAMRVGIVIYRKLTGTRYDLTCTMRRGSRKVTIDGVPIEELIERNYIAPIAPLLERMRSERLSSYEVDINIGGLEWNQDINPLIMGYALWQALDNILSKL